MEEEEMEEGEEVERRRGNLLNEGRGDGSSGRRS